MKRDDKIGRPEDESPQYIPTEIGKIFKDCGAPASWGDAEFGAIWGFVMAPYCPDTPRNDVVFTKLWRESSEVMLEAMPKIYKLAERVRANPQVRYVSYYCCLRELAKGPHANEVANRARERLQYFDNAKSHDVAVELRGDIVGLNATHVRNARQSLRNVSMIAH